MIGVKLHGRFGNQMFQYAFAYSMAKKLKTSFFIDPYLSKFELPLYFELKGQSRLKSILAGSFFLLNKFVLKLTGRSLMRVLPENSQDEDYRFFNQRGETPADNVIYNGYFQSADYFRDCENSIYNIFRIKRKYTREFERKYGNLFKEKTVAVHVRRADYTSAGCDELGGKDISLPVRYYQAALGMIENLDSYRVIFVSDEIEWIKQNIKNEKNFYFLNNSMIMDFQLIMNADIAVISNSSFSWWAAALNRNVKTVYAPKYWLGHKSKKEYPPCICKRDWNLIEFS